MGSNVEVLTPLKLREEMRDDILEMGKLYKQVEL
jgi:predicted DNA-binding transcriptional regulator YafY